MIHVGWLAPTDCWDQNTLSLLLSNQLYPTGIRFKHHNGYPNTSDGCILVIPGRFWSEHVDRINQAIARFPWVLAFRVSDEEDWFDIHDVEHENIRWWVQTPRTDRDYGDARLFGVGFPAHFNNLQWEPPGKTTDVFLSAQNTHVRRNEAFKALAGEHDRWCVEETPGFTQGMDPAAYATLMVSAKIAPAPAGACSPDSFRLFEALEAHAVPIADDVSPVYDSAGYWERLFPDAPFMIFEDYEDLPLLIEDELECCEAPWCANRIAAWWIRQKRLYTHWLRDDLEQLGAW
jgi:hypothetical protein